MEPFKWFDAFVDLTRLEATLVAETGLRVGQGRSMESTMTDLPLLRSHDGKPLLPGASLKGVLRSAAERLLRGLAMNAGGDAARVACDPLLAPCFKGGSDAMGDGDDTKETRGRVVEHRKQVSDRACLACATFGLAGLAAHVRFHDACAAGSAQVRDGVSIDRDLGRVSGGRKFDFEVVHAGARFPLLIEGENLVDWQRGLLRASLRMVEGGGVRIGGFGSRGLGVCRVEELTVTVRTLDDILEARPGEMQDEATQGRWMKALREAVAERARTEVG